MKTYIVVMDQRELQAISELIIYGRAISQTLPNEALSRKLQAYAQTVEALVERTKKENPEFPFTEKVK